MLSKLLNGLLTAPADLTQLLKNKAANLAALEDKGYHEIFEAIFGLVLSENRVYRDQSKPQAKRNGSSTRLSKCAAALRVAVARGSVKLERKTLLALVDHITEFLPGPDDRFIQPLVSDYVKALTEVLARPYHVESLARKEGGPWQKCVDFLIKVAKYSLPDESQSIVVPLGRDSSGPALSAPRSTRSIVGTQSQNRSYSLEGGPLRDSLEGLKCLVQAATAPISSRSEDIMNLILGVLGVKHLSLGSTQTVCFAIVNNVLASTHADDLTFANHLVRSLLPLMGFWWRPERVSQDELIKALRNEISKTVILTHLHMEHLAIVKLEVTVREQVEGLLEPLWLEYSKRNEAFRLQLSDITFCPDSLPEGSLRLDLFGLRHHNVDGEGPWALVQNLALLEAILLRPNNTQGDDGPEQRHKRRRLREGTSRLKLKLKSKDVGIQRTALQLIPFLVATHCSNSIMGLDRLCAALPQLQEDHVDTWRQLWHVAARCLSLPATSRASCILLLAILHTGLLPYHSLSEDINNFVVTADVNGPALLCDSSLSLMSRLFHERNARLPSASQATSSHVTRWVFLKWNPNEPGYASSQSIHVSPLQLANLLRACCGVQPLPWHGQQAVFGSTLGETWRQQREIEPFMRYLLLLQPEGTESRSDGDERRPAGSQSLSPANSGNFYSARKLTLELLQPKLKELRALCESWQDKAGQRGSRISVEGFHSLLSACLAGALILPQISDLNSAQSSTLEAELADIAEKSLTAALDSVEPLAAAHSALRLLRSCMPYLATESLNHLHREQLCLLRIMAISSCSLAKRRLEYDSQDSDLMDIDDDFDDSQMSKVTTSSATSPFPRQVPQLYSSPRAFYIETKARLALLQALYNDSSQIGLVPKSWLDSTLSMSNDDLCLCHGLLVEICHCDLLMSPGDGLNLVQRLGDTIGKSEYRSCEVALTACIEVLDGLHSMWLGDNPVLADRAGDLYDHFIRVALPSGILSPRAQSSMARLLFTLLRADPDYGKNLGLDSCRTSLLYILERGKMKVKCFIGDRIASIFELFILQLHDEVFVDVLNSLPADADDTAGIAYRLLVLSRLACRWPTLLRRCIYHIFETPGKISHATDYATSCLADVAHKLGLSSPKKIFHLFSRQLLYTWMENDSLRDIPFSIFGFDDLKSLLSLAQAEAVGLAMMRGQENVSADLAQIIGSSTKELLRSNFTTAFSYCMVYADVSRDPGPMERIETILGRRAYTEAISANFVDIVALFFNLIDQDSSLEKAFLRYPELAYAADSLKAVRSIAHSPADLPPNQQPTFKARFVMHSLLKLCQEVKLQFSNLWTPALVLSVTRRLFNTVHPALGSLHACSVLRKVRLVLCLAGPVALETYCLEMLLNSARSFMVDSECADDALGMTQYLLVQGSRYLRQRPSFLAGFSLSTLASLRVFLESSQSSTTQESQFKATMGKARQFHEFFRKYLADYTSSAFRSDIQATSFKSITHSAGLIRSSGNAEKGMPESKLLLDILQDGATGQGLLDESSRKLALGLLCGDFTIAADIASDIIESDEDAVSYAGVVWRSCEAQKLSSSYLAWAGRVVGRSFLASGYIPDGILRESRLLEYKEMAPPGSNGSETGILCLLQQLASNQDSVVAGLSEVTLRTVVSQALLKEDEELLAACQKTLSDALFLASQWGAYRSPPSEALETSIAADAWTEDVVSEQWLSRLSVCLARSVPESILLSALPPSLEDLKDLAEKSLPFVVHLVLYFQLRQPTTKRQLSAAIKEWLSSKAPRARNNLKLLINVILYLRTQEFPRETSIDDRSQWLDIDYASAAAAAARCGMYNTALLFAELAASESTRPSRRSSQVRQLDMNDTLLTIFENIDDPDAYYGLPEDASLANVLARVEHEREGSKCLAFRGAQYDSHLRLRSLRAEADGQALVGALSTLGLSGLSNSLLQTQQELGFSGSAMETTFRTARRLEMWDLPVPSTSEHHSVTVYKAYQSIQQATDLPVARSAVYDSLSRIMGSLTGTSLNATALRGRLASLASLTELDDLINVTEPAGMSSMLHKFQARCQWMRSGLYDDVSEILSCRETTTSLLSQHGSFVSSAKLPVTSLRRMQVETMLLASGIYRYHQASQESLNISTSLNMLIPVCEELGLHVDAAVKMEVASSLWDHGEMSSSVRMLQAIDKGSSLAKQTIHVSRSELLSKIGHRVSIARLEKPQDIQKTYLEPALKELKRDSSRAEEEGAVYHQFATFCDEQLQDADGLEDLERLQSLRKGRSDDVAAFKALIATTKDSQLRSRYSHALSREKQWLELDEQELRRVEQTRGEFLRLSLENYLLSLATSDEHNNDALRFTALWLERSTEEATNKAVARHLNKVPTRKFAGLINQLTSRLQNEDSVFQNLLFNLVMSICTDHPYHGMYQIWSGTRVKPEDKDEVAVLRVKATQKVAQRLAGTKDVAGIWLSIDRASRSYHFLAGEKSSGYKSGAKVALTKSKAGSNLMACLSKYKIPPPTMHLDVSATKNYSGVPYVVKLEPMMTIASGISAPKIITAVGSDGVKYKQLVKGGHDDLRQDAIMEQVFAAVSSLLKLHRSTRQRNLGIRTYKVLPLTASSGLIEFVPNTVPLNDFLMPAHERYYPKDLKGSQCRRELSEVQNQAVETRIKTYRRVTERFHPVLRYFFMENFLDPDEWFSKRLAYTRSTAAISILGHVLGLGDRHGHNILLDTKTGEAVHIDLGVAFEAGRILPVPELVPFRLTRDIVDGMGITKTEGVFRRCCEFTLDALREEQYTIMTILDVLRYDPLHTWSISPVRLAKLQKSRRQDDGSEAAEQGGETTEAKGGSKSVSGRFNEPSGADRALEVVRKKLAKTLSVKATVNDLINQASDERNLAVLFSAMATARAWGKLPEMPPGRQPPSTLQPYSGARKLVIKNLRTASTRDGNAQLEDYYVRTERELGAALDAIFAGNRPAVPLERLYRGVEDMCRKGAADEVYKMLVKRMETHLQTVVLPRIKLSGTEVVRSFLAEWNKWNDQAKIIRSTFCYFDRTHLLLESLPTINEMAITHFRQMAFSSSQREAASSLGSQVVAGICEMIYYDREGDARLDYDLLKESVRMLHTLSVYVKYFEPVFLRKSEAYFRDCGEQWNASGLKQHISACETLLRKEEYRCLAYNLESTTAKQLMDSAHDILIDHYSDKLLHGDSLSQLLSNGDVKSVKGLYDLLRLSGIQKKMKAPWCDYIRTTGAEIIADGARGDEMVIRLLDLRRSLDVMLRDALDKDEDLLWGMREAFGKFMNDRLTASCWDSGTSKIGEMTAKHMDMLLRGGLKALPKQLISDVKDRAAAEKEGQAASADEDAELDRQLDQALELFRFIEGKDAFEAFYKKDLARRLLMGRSASQDAERNMLTRLRGECGSNFTHNLEQMFKDQELAKDEMESYKQWSKGSGGGGGGGGGGVDLHVMVLSAAAWPTYADVRLNLPDEVATQLERFDGHYRNKHTGRVLTWKHSLAHCSLKASFPRGAKELLVSASQAVVLIVFNAVADDGFQTYEQLSTATGLQGTELQRTLQSLACGKARVLCKHPKGRDVKTTDTFSINKAFSDAKYRIKINQIQLKETKEDNKATHERISQDRRFETQATIVRVMKSRKRMGHAELVAEVINLTKQRGSVEPAAIKKEIERRSHLATPSPSPAEYHRVMASGERPGVASRHYKHGASPKHHAGSICDIRPEMKAEAEARQKLSSYVVTRMKKHEEPDEVDEEGCLVRPTWQRVSRCLKMKVSQEEAARRVDELNLTTGSAREKKSELGESVQRQMERAREDLEAEDTDSRYQHVIAQIESLVRPYPRDVARVRAAAAVANEGRKRKSKAKFRHHERVQLTVYFKRMPRTGENAVRMLEEEERRRKRQMGGVGGVVVKQSAIARNPPATTTPPPATTTPTPKQDPPGEKTGETGKKGDDEADVEGTKAQGVEKVVDGAVSKWPAGKGREESTSSVSSVDGSASGGSGFTTVESSVGSGIIGMRRGKCVIVDGEADYLGGAETKMLNTQYSKDRFMMSSDRDNIASGRLGAQVFLYLWPGFCPAL
ncbi:hypothetical protein CP532_0008 [Ophiocordyceps camponoti-leonardi (nom. inval.)]|nr:hypothetical protein CP532_0008 [Ophiocordyceps camponoti-leonardi (nom. inval.)]